MDNATLSALVHQLVPIVAILITFGCPVAIVWTVKHFKLKDRELELEAQLHSRELELRLRTLEARQGAVETALTAIGARPVGLPPVEQRMSLLEPSSTSTESAEVQPADPQRVRNR